MVRPWRIRYSGAKYHVTSRGNGRQNIFLAEDDLKQMKLNKATYGDIVLPDIESIEPTVVDKAVAREFGVGIDELHRGVPRPFACLYLESSLHCFLI